MTRMRKAPAASLLVPFIFLVAAFALAGCPGSTSSDNDSSGGSAAGSATNTGANNAGGGNGKKITIAWAEWEPAKQLEKLTQDFTKETGIAVEVQQIPWSNFETEIKKTWSAQGDTYDLIIGDSQWLGKGATAGHYVDLTEWAKTNIPIADIAPAALKSYGEYPAGSGKLYAVPCMSDAIGFAYRKDLFEDPTEKAAFQAKYGRPLATPKTWDEFRQVAEFFTRPDKGLYGAALFFSKEYDGATMGFDQILWSYGGKLSEGNKAQGVINSPTALKALQFYVDLKKYTPPGSENDYFSQCLTHFQEGKVAMAENWFAFMPDLVSKEKNKKYADVVGFFPVPKGPAGQFASLGGQGLSLSAYSKNQDAAKQFISWFSKEENQKKWAALGGLTANTKVAATPEFKSASPYNEAFTQTVPHLKDFYNNPEYSELMQSTQKHLNEAVAGTTTPKAALDAIAKEHQAILDGAGS